MRCYTISTFKASMGTILWVHVLKEGGQGAEDVITNGNSQSGEKQHKLKVTTPLYIFKRNIKYV
ncbi:hypothetical protein SLEP1_g18756 [Rubroshorea leprosula]|uniref:Uncharacterized protein n=1 Tax=Rubroshorea leprosula TaxID=152421 RepID=A0AAV5J982_9ROSI|nr:hypothetical protein SLEP1_g18756 [Rubroshorea leprosula]